MKDRKMCCSYDPETGQCKHPNGTCGKVNYSNNMCKVKGHPVPGVDTPSETTTNYEIKR